MKLSTVNDVIIKNCVQGRKFTFFQAKEKFPISFDPCHSILNLMVNIFLYFILPLWSMNEISP